MKYVVASIYDNVAEAYMKPVFFRSEGEALRSWMDIVNDPQSEFSKHPDHYVLVQVGVWDEDEGVMYEESSPSRINVSGSQVYNKSAQEVVG